MDPPQRSKPNTTPPGHSVSGPGKSPAQTGAVRPPSPPREAVPSGRVRHDDRGNAVWDWIKETGRHALESTSRLLRRLEAPQLEVEDKQDEELRVQSDREPGGGYDPYNQSTTPRKPR